jgi:hypothetical protein
MRPLLILLASLACGLLIGRATARHGSAEAQPAPAADLPRGGVELLAAVPFVVEEPFAHEWRAEAPLVSAGWLIALRADEDLTRTRETFEPVLYVGRETAERACLPITGPVMVALVPAPLGSDGRVEPVLDSAPLWFGTAELPERVDAARIEREHALALARGLGPAARAAAVRTRFEADEAVHARTRDELEPYLEDLAERFGAR